eukprot:SAG31_NODE_4777_length_2960_cov_1.962950_1_plen_198_part_00
MRAADAIVSEIVDAALVGEGLLGAICHARNVHAKPGAVVIPRAARLFAMVVNCPALEFKTAGTSWMNVGPPGRELDTLSVDMRVEQYTALTDAVQVGDVNLTGCLQTSEVRLTARAPVIAAGTITGLLVWFELELLDGISISTLAGPAGTRGHWGQVVLVPRDPINAGTATDIGGTVDLWLMVREDVAWLDGGWSTE